MIEEKDKNDPLHLEVQPPSEEEDKNEKLFSGEVFKDDLELEDDIEKLPL